LLRPGAVSHLHAFHYRPPLGAAALHTLLLYLVMPPSLPPPSDLLTLLLSQIFTFINTPSSLPCYSSWLNHLWKWNRVLQNVSTENSDIRESPKQKNTT